MFCTLISSFVWFFSGSSQVRGLFLVFLTLNKSFGGLGVPFAVPNNPPSYLRKRVGEEVSAFLRRLIVTLQLSSTSAASIISIWTHCLDLPCFRHHTTYSVKAMLKPQFVQHQTGKKNKSTEGKGIGYICNHILSEVI